MPSVLSLEQMFNLKVDSYTINGAIDRIDQTGINPKTKKPLVKIVDYKTGKVRDKFARDDKFQLLIYAMAVKDANILGGDVKELEYYFIDANESILMAPTVDDEAATLDWIRSTVTKIQTGDFRATPDVMTCKFCDYKDICEFRKI